MNSKSILTVIITAIVVGSGVYLWQNQLNNGQRFPEKNQSKAVSNVTPENTKVTANLNVVDAAKNSDAKFLYLVSSPSLEKTQVIIKGFWQNFALEYPWNEWREMYFTNNDLTASGGGEFNRFDELQTLDFCAGSYICDMTKKEGKGFQMQIWNANFSGRKENANFFKKNGEILIKETNKVILTYKPYNGQYAGQYGMQNVAGAVAKLFESFELVK